MKINSISLAILAASCISSVAQPNWVSRFEYQASSDAFRAGETQLDMFGLYATSDRDNFSEDTWGLGIGGNYFVTDQLGFGLDTYVADVDWPKHIEASVIGRYPLYERYHLSMAPYGFVGIGRQFFDKGQWTGHIGGGVEYRLNHSTGVFLDLRGVFADQSKDFMVWRFGVRLVF
ncbi:MAG TPA: hypothetical protein VEH04_09645 [Verrucomicrobiae bacterium]|nr:hypothetical protein [Verrucomicrobiae bacterium]